MNYKFILIILIVSQAVLADPVLTTSQDYQRARKIFRKLNQSDMGREAIVAIQAELNMTEDKNLVDKILRVLHDLLENNQIATKTAQEELARAQKEQTNRNEWNVKTLTQLKSKIESQKVKLVDLEDRNIQLEQALVVATKNQEAYVSTLGDVEAKNEQALADYAASVKKHDSIIEALIKARELIMRLSTNGQAFLQVEPATIMLEMHNHIQQISTSGLGQKLLELTLKIAKADIQANQEQVATVIQIIDDLLEAEARAKTLELQVEQKRRLMFENKRASIKANEHRIEGQKHEAFADHKTNQIRIQENSADISGWEQRITELDGQQVDLDSYYNSRLVNLRQRLDALKNFNELIQQVIDIFQSDKIQNEDVKNVANVQF